MNNRHQRNKISTNNEINFKAINNQKKKKKKHSSLSLFDIYKDLEGVPQSSYKYVSSFHNVS